KCPTCRLIRRMNERNTRSLYKRKCDFSGKEIISQYHANAPFPVYHYDDWFGDSWDAMKYGQSIDFTKPFFEQFKVLRDKVPHMSAFVVGGTLQNSDYTNCTGYLKDCYLIFEADYNENCYYDNRIYHCKSVVDCLCMYGCELCYESRDSLNCYNLKYSHDCEDCSDSLFLSNCKGCKNCIACINLRHKDYHIFNKPCSPDEFAEFISKNNLNLYDGVSSFYKKADDFFAHHPHKNLQQEHNVNSLGDYLVNCKNAYYCFDCKDLEDCRYCARVAMTVKSTMDMTGWGDNVELAYETAACGNNAYNLKFCTTCTTNNSDLEYCDQCVCCKNCFGCVGLNKKSYCIFNKQYTKEEYLLKKEKLVEHMMETKEYGEFFPADSCPFAYNESIAMEYFPLTEKEALVRGFRWLNDNATCNPQTYVVPAKISDVPDSVVDEVLACKSCEKNYRITSNELKFYRHSSLPIPFFCANCRHLRRLKSKNPKSFWERKCDKCGKNIMTTFPPESKCPIYCEECYLGIL
ncbi:MAG: hypothetical protein AAB540_00540, partial [Patescibacteria group bacterium]